PHVSDFGQKLDLPTPLPITQEQVRQFYCFPRTDHIGGRVVLTNHCEFVFDHGRMERFESPRSFFNLQDPSLVPKFYTPVKLSEAQALQIAHDAIKKLGYTDAMLAADRPPEITSPKRNGTNYIARYRVRWTDPTRGGNPQSPRISIEFEIDATTGQIWYLYINNPNTYLSDPQLEVQPTVIGQGPQATPVGPGRKVTPVSPEYARKFLDAILPQLSDFVKNTGFADKVPVFASDVNMARYLEKYNCGIVEGDPRAYIDMITGNRFMYSHGRVVAFYSSDAMNHPDREKPVTYPGIDSEQAKFFGKINMTTNDAVALVRKTIKKLGYAETELPVGELPVVSEPGWWGTNRVARCNIIWYTPDDGEHFKTTKISAEVDMATKTLKSLYINDHVNTNIWRKPPNVGIPLSTLPIQDEPPVSAQAESIREPKPPVNLPPNMPLPTH
ncbi:MAG TPA: PepSY domain-containing protein, partial [Verrucomicrobiae bacterium]|nr:PepSY domain-containing protein [Verrucomicrobiae bacterium]